MEGASSLTTDALSETTEHHHLNLGTSAVWTDPNPLDAVISGRASEPAE
jgi:hypothetical protein